MLKVNARICTSDSSRFSSLSIVNGEEYSKFIANNSKLESYLVCPTDALQLNNCKIEPDLCIECLLCYFASPPGLIDVKLNPDSLNGFLQYCMNDSKFAIRWLAIFFQSSDPKSRCGLEIKIDGGARNRRIPLVHHFEQGLAIWKVADTNKDIEKAALALTDIRDSIRDINDLPTPRCFVGLTQEASKYVNDGRTIPFLEEHTKQRDYSIVSLEYLWKIATSTINRESKFIEWGRELYESTSRILIRR